MASFRKLMIVACIGLIAPGIALAREIGFQINVDRTKIGLGQAIQLDLTFDGTQNMPAPELPQIDGFQSRYLGPATRMSVVNGQVSSSITHMYSLLSTKKGSFKFGPLTFDYNGDTYNSNQLTVEVGEITQAAPMAQGQGDDAAVGDISQHIFMAVQPQKKSAYLNEKIPVTVKLYVNSLSVQDIQFPQLGHDGFSVGAYEKPRQYQEQVGGITYEVVEFTTTIFGIRPGEFRLGPASLQCNLLVRKKMRRSNPNSMFDEMFDDSLFDAFTRYQAYPYSVKSADVPVQVLPLPEEGKPDGFGGALGDFTFEAEAAPREVKVGDPVTLKAAISGEGNLATANLPQVAGEDFKVYEAQAKIENGVKNFEQVLIPLKETVKEIPAMTFNYFNTRSGKYETIVRGPFPLKVSRADNPDVLKVVENQAAAAPVKAKEEKLGRDIIFIKDNAGQLRRQGEALHKNKLFLGFQLIPLLCYLLTLGIYSRRRRLMTDVRYARQLSAPRVAREGMAKARALLDKGETAQFYDRLFATLQGYLGDRFHLASKSITLSVIDEQLKDKGVSPEVLAKLSAIFKECDMVRYAASSLSREDMAASLKRLEEVIDYFQRNKV